MTEEGKNRETIQEHETDESPQVYAVQKDLTGWRFNRREFLAAAAVATAIAGMTAGCRYPEDEAPASTENPPTTRVPADVPASVQPSISPSPESQLVMDVTVPTGTIVTPGQTFTKTWRVTNKSDSPWGSKTQLVFESGARMEADSPVPVGSVNTGDTVDISVSMTAPIELGWHAGQWSLCTANNTIMTLTVKIFVASSDPESPESIGAKIEVNIDGETNTYYISCGSSIPPGAVCVCNCVATCACVGHQTCTCVGHRVCTCDAAHYWYPN